MVICNDILKKRELYENKLFQENSSDNDYLYPNLNDPNFNIKIAEKKEFNDTKYELNKQVDIIIKLSDKTALNPTSFA